MLVKDVMTTKAITVKKDVSILDVMKLMREANIGFVIVEEENKPIGVITDRDIVLKLAINQDTSIPVESYMHKKVITLNESKQISDASDILGNMQIKRLVVVNNLDEITGVLSLADLARHVLLEEYALEALTEISYDFSEDFDNIIHVETCML